jgi:hypothetical protein
MNKFLASGLATMNAFVAFILIVAGALGGLAQAGVPGLFVGLLGAGVLSVILCGILAIFIQMHEELILIREALQRTPPK